MNNERILHWMPYYWYVLRIGNKKRLVFEKKYNKIFIIISTVIIYLQLMFFFYLNMPLSITLPYSLLFFGILLFFTDNIRKKQMIIHDKNYKTYLPYKLIELIEKDSMFELETKKKLNDIRCHNGGIEMFEAETILLDNIKKNIEKEISNEQNERSTSCTSCKN